MALLWLARKNRPHLGSISHLFIEINGWFSQGNLSCEALSCSNKILHMWWLILEIWNCLAEFCVAFFIACRFLCLISGLFQSHFLIDQHDFHTANSPRVSLRAVKISWKSIGRFWRNRQYKAFMHLRFTDEECWKLFSRVKTKVLIAETKGLELSSWTVAVKRKNKSILRPSLRLIR